MKKFLVTTYLKDSFPKFNRNKIYLNLPNNMKQSSKNSFYYCKRWKNSKNLKKDFEYIDQIYEEYLLLLTNYLNKFHKKNYSKKYWRILLGIWLYRFISNTFERWSSIKEISSIEKNLEFYQLQYKKNEMIPQGLEDFSYFINLNFWNLYIYTEIINFLKLKSIKIKKINKKLDTNEIKQVYQKLNKDTFKEKCVFFFQNLIMYFNKNNKYFVFDTYMSSINQLKINFMLNKNFSFFRSLKFSFLNNYLTKDMIINRAELKIEKKNNNLFEKFITTELLNNIPKTFLESFQTLEKSLEKNILPKSPKVIFTTLGINRSTIMDRYIASKIENGTKLFLGQHGGIYGQFTNHWHTKHEIKISDKFLTWGWTEGKKTKSVGVIKNISLDNYKTKKLLIFLEIRGRLLFDNANRVDCGGKNSIDYINACCSFFSLIKNEKIINNLRVKLHHRDFGWEERIKFLRCNSKIKFMNNHNKMIKEIYKAKLVLHTYPSTGHLECLATNTPILMFYFNDFKYLKPKTKKYFEKFVKLGILHTKPKSLYKKLLEINDDVDMWWSRKEIQNTIKKYTSDFSYYNPKQLNDIKKIII